MSVAKDIGKGTIYNALAKYTGIIVNLVVTGVLARILSPDEFGVVALTTVFIVFFDLLGNMGLGPAIIQNKTLDNKDLASIFNLSVILAIILGLICIFTSPVVAHMYEGNEELSKIMKILSVQVFFTIINVVPYSLLLKHKKFGIIALCSVCCQILFGTVAIISAFASFGVYSLLIAPIGTSFSLFLVYSILTSKNYGSYYFIVLKFKSIKKVLSFSFYQFLFNVVNYFSRNLDKILIGNRFSMSDLGYYEKSYRLMQLPISNVSSVLTPTIQPVLSQYQDDRTQLSKYTVSILRILAYIGCILTPLLYISAKEIILIIFGEKWIPAVPIFQILSLSVFAQLTDSASGSLLQASNSPKLLFLSGLICAVINISAILVGVFLYHSLSAMSWILDIAFILNLIIDLYFIFCISLKKNLKIVLHIFKHPFIVAIILISTLWPLSQIPSNNIYVRVIIFSVVSIIEGFVYAQLIGLLDIRKLLNSYIHKKNEYIKKNN